MQRSRLRASLALFTVSLLAAVVACTQSPSESGQSESVESTLARLREVRSAAMAADAERFKSQAEPLLREFRSIEAVLQRCRERGLETDDSAALAGFVELALRTQAVAPLTGFYGSGFDPGPFVDQVVETLPSLPPDQANVLLRRLRKEGMLGPEHAEVVCALMEFEASRYEAVRCMITLPAESMQDCAAFERFLESTDGDEYLAAVRGEVWCEAVRRAPAHYAERARSRLELASVQDYERGALVECMLDSLAPETALEIALNHARSATSVDARWMEWMQRLTMPDAAEAAKAEFVRLELPAGRCYCLAIAVREREFLQAVADSDRALAVRSWARYFLAATSGSWNVRAEQASGLARECVSLPLDHDVRQTADRLLVTLQLLSDGAGERDNGPRSALALDLRRLMSDTSFDASLRREIERLGQSVVDLAPSAARPEENR